jgi:hypothetical protein
MHRTQALSVAVSHMLDVLKGLRAQAAVAQIPLMVHAAECGGTCLPKFE